MGDFEGSSRIYAAPAKSVGARRSLRLCAAILLSFLAFLPLHSASADQATSALRQTSPATTNETGIDLPESLQVLYERGGTPKTLQQFVEIERQVQRLSSRLSDCTVNVAIGAAQGCGVIVTSSGYVLTAAHVAMRPGKTAIITFSNGRTVTAKTLGMNRNVDAGLMKINDGQNNGQPWPHATLGRSERLRPGMWCIATGHPGGFDLERGPVTRVGRILTVRNDSLVTDCALIGGDSGGPLFDLTGRLIAVHSRIGNDVADNLHVPVEHYDASWERLANSEAWGYLEGFRPVLGVLKDASTQQAKIGGVRKNSPAEAAGIREGDVIDQFGDYRIRTFQDLTAAVADTMPGERVQCWINRNGESVRVTVEIGRDEE